MHTLGDSGGERKNNVGLSCGWMLSDKIYVKIHDKTNMVMRSGYQQHIVETKHCNTLILTWYNMQTVFVTHTKTLDVNLKPTSISKESLQIFLFISGDLTPVIRTGYTCEGEELMIQCEEDSDIQIIRANYGRFSIAICNDDGKTHWSVNCMSPKTRHILQKRYSGSKTNLS